LARQTAAAKEFSGQRAAPPKQLSKARRTLSDSLVFSRIRQQSPKNSPSPLDYTPLFSYFYPVHPKKPVP
jgi:hypothetical protein